MERKEKDNVIFVSGDKWDSVTKRRIGKHVSEYVLAVLTQVNMGFDNIFIKARGRAISKAVDVSQVIINQHLKSWEIKNIEVGTEIKEVPDRETKDIAQIKVSHISIEISKK